MKKLILPFLALFLFSEQLFSQPGQGCGSTSVNIYQIEQGNTQLFHDQNNRINVPNQDTLNIILKLGQPNCRVTCPGNITFNGNPLKFYSCEPVATGKIQLSIIPHLGNYSLTGITDGGYYTTNFEISSVLTVGIQDADAGLEKPIFPNPFTNTFDIPINTNMNALSIEIFNSIGELVHISKSINDNMHTVEFSNQKQGVYFVKLIYAEGMNVQRVVKR